MSLLSISTSVDISCAYSNQNFIILTNIYSCVIESVNSPENPVVRVTGSHMPGKRNDDVKGLFGNIGNVLKFPRDISNSLKNLVAIYFTVGQIRELSSDDLKPFPELLELYFDNNKIEVIEEGTFDFNPKLAGISFMSNGVFHINANVFDHLTDLRYLWLNNNKCSNGIARNDRNTALNLIATAKHTCQNQAFLRMEKKLKDLADSLKTSTTTIKPVSNVKTFGNMQKIFNDFEVDSNDMQSQFSHKLLMMVKHLKGNLSQTCV